VSVRVIRAPTATASSPEELEGLVAAAQARGNEGLMIKDLESAYTPGRRGKSWLKMKREVGNPGTLWSLPSSTGTVSGLAY